MSIFEGGPLERRVMEKVGCLDYSVTEWEPVRPDVYQRQVHYKFDKKSAQHEGEAMSTQQKSPLPNKNGWLVEEVMAFEGIPIGECFNVRADSWYFVLYISISVIYYISFEILTCIWCFSFTYSYSLCFYLHVVLGLSESNLSNFGQFIENNNNNYNTKSISLNSA